MSNKNINAYSFYRYLISNGYYFDKKLIENYLLSLKVKPFTILTGNSGTGKTKLSQLFAKYINSEIIDPKIEPNEDKEKYVNIKGKINYSSWSNQGWTLEKSNFENYIPLKHCEEPLDILINDTPTEGQMMIGIQLFYDSVDLKNHMKTLYNENNLKGRYNKNTPEIDIKINCQGIKELLDDYSEIDNYVLLEQNSNKSAYEKGYWMLNMKIFDYLPFKKGFVPCKIIIDGIKSFAKLRITPRFKFNKTTKIMEILTEKKGQKVELKLKINNKDFKNFKPKWDCDKPNENVEKIETHKNADDKYIIVPVGANWTDNTNIIGYYNVITNEYHSTPAYDFIQKAENDSKNPYFLILDEMNLSHVERYFADFLSAIESKEEIPLYGKDRTIKLPENIFLIGTVNVDETTYMFSPKVLDRANTIEFDTLDAIDYMNNNINTEDFNGNIEYLQSPLIDSDISDLNIEELKEVLSNISYNGNNLWDILANELTIFQKTLKSSGFDFGFRVINEILRFMIVSWKYEKTPTEWNNWQRYFDAQIKQKILPKLHGSEKAIGDVLIKLFNNCLNNRENNENPKNFKIKTENARYPSSAMKLQNMAKVLSQQRYVSFIN
ncbi:McrB family protein [uncultured Methanobrevibacter sp.]|uniref:McrB family protein n=1 Tax=uncultured Methanobrevibacter sp. TaxID=253161 RepID=UPI00260026CC|nr:hypothetical protein [uncultured Methanobrevibacter sp.]